jgi:hypothetical protein
LAWYQRTVGYIAPKLAGLGFCTAFHAIGTLFM